MVDLHNHIPMKIMYQNSPSLKLFFDSQLHDAAGSQTSKSNYTVEAKDEKILWCESGAQVDTSSEKSRGPKIWRYCPFKDYLTYWLSKISGANSPPPMSERYIHYTCIVSGPIMELSSIIHIHICVVIILRER
jgi:hypothetical protein